MTKIIEQNIEGHNIYYIEESKGKYSELIEVFHEKTQAERFVNLYKKALAKNKEITPCSKTWKLSLSDYGLYYNFDDVSQKLYNSTGLVRG